MRCPAVENAAYVHVAHHVDHGPAAVEEPVDRQQDGDLVGFVPKIVGSEDFDEAQVIDAIARTDYDKPVARLRAEAPPAGAPLPPVGGVFRRFLDGFRYR